MRTRRDKDEIRCTGCGTLTGSVSYHPITKTGSYCDSCTAQNESGQPLLPQLERIRTESFHCVLCGCSCGRCEHGPFQQPLSHTTTCLNRFSRSRVDIRRDDHEPVFQHQAERDRPVSVNVKNEIDSAYRRDMYDEDDDYDPNNDPWPTEGR